jgi:hypothetical protein
MEDKENSDRFMPILIFIFFGVLWYLIRRSAGDYYISKGIFEVLALAFVLVASQAILWISRYYMPHVTVNGFSGSILGRPVLIKEVSLDKKEEDIYYAVFNTGEFLEPFHGRGKLATLVVPWNQLNQAGRNFVGLTFVKKTPVRSLPPLVYRYLLRSGLYNVENVYFGKYAEKFQHVDPKVALYEDQLENVQSQVNLRNDLIDDRNDVLAEQVKTAEELTHSKRSWLDFLRRKPTADQPESQ